MPSRARQQAFRIALIYVIAAGCWHLLSNELLKRYGGNLKESLDIDTIKDWSFVILMGGILHQGLRRLLRQWEQETELRKETENNLRRIERALKTISACNGVLVRATSEAMLLAEICRVVVETGDYRLAWVGFAHNDAEKSITIAARAGQDAGYLDKADVSWSEDVERGRGPIGTAIRTGEIVVCNDFLTDPQTVPWRQAATRHGFASAIVLPLHHAEKSFGVLTIYAAEANAFNLAEVELLHELADDLGYGIQALRTRAEQLQAEEALHENESLLRSIMENTKDVIFVKDRECRFVYMNPAGCRLNGMTPDKLLGRSKADFHPNSSEASQIMTDDRRVMESSLEESIEEAIGAADGTRHVFLTTKVARRDRQGKVIGLIGVARDITERKLAEETSAAQQRLLDSLIAAVPDLIYFKNGESRLIRINEAFARRAGLTDIHAALGKTDFDIFGEAHARQAYDDEQRIMATGQPMINQEEREDWPDGRVTWATSTKVPLFDHSGKIVGIMGISRDITERKQAEDTLARERNLLRKILDILPDYIYLKDEQSRVVLCNNRRVDNDGMPVNTDDLIGKTAADFFPAEQAAQFRTDELVVLGGTPLIEKEETLIRRDGSKQVILTTKLPFRDSTGKIVGLLGYGRDITERKQAEEALARERNLLRMMFDLLPDHIYLKDEQSRFVMFNRPCTANDAMPTTAEELTGKTDADFYPPEQAARFRADELVVLGGTPLIDKEETLFLPDGSKQVILTTKLPFRDGNGKIVGLLGYGRDITGRKRIEEQVRLQSTALTAAANAMMITDRHGEIEWVNPAFIKLTGYSAAEVMGANPRLLKSGQHPPGFYASLWATISAGNVWHGEFVNQRRDGQLYTEDTTITPVRDADGQIAHFIAIKQDVTERRQLENQLRQSQKMEAIGQLAGGVAHDFNNILAALLMQIELIEMAGNLPQEAADGLEQIHAFTNRAADLTRQLLLFSRRQVMQPRHLDLNEIVTNLAKMLQRIIGEDVRLQLNLHPVPLITHADAGMIEQVLMNLAVNARDAMPKGGHLRIDTTEANVAEPAADPDAKPGRHVCISVSDTGGGISPEVLPKIFEPFFTTKEAGKGTGLGLATVFGIVKQHHGWIKVDNRPGQGVTFQVFLPPSTLTVAETPQLFSKPMPRGGKETILLVEDELEVRNLICKILKRHGYQVLEATNGVEALDVWREQRETVALLVTDLVMPAGLSGQELARQLQAAQPNLKVIFISGYSAEIAGRELQLHDGENFIQKPFAADRLLETVRQSLDA